MGRLYSVPMSSVAVSAAQDLWSLKTSANVPLLLHMVNMSQTTDVGNANEEMLRIRITRGFTTQGSGGTTPTPAKYRDSGDAAAACTTHMNDTSVANTGTDVVLYEDSWNTRAGWLWLPTPEDRIWCPVGVIIRVNLPAAPAGSRNCNGTLLFEEFGN
jgi:hypothetical protein